MVWYKERYNRIHIKVSCVPTGEGRTSKTSQNSLAFAYLEMKLEHITMDFIVDLPRTQIDHDAIWVIVYRLTKSAHFLAICSIFSLKRLAKLYINEIVKFHGVSVSIMSN